MPLVDWEAFASSFISFEEKLGTFTSVDKFGATSPVEDIPAVRGAVTNEMFAETDGATVRPSAAYQIRRVNLVAQPKPGDLWEEGGTEYRIQLVHFDDAHWIIAVYDPKIDAQLADLCNVYQYTQTKTAKGTRRVSAILPTFAGVACRTQPRTVELSEQSRRIGNLFVWDIYFDVNLPILPDVNVIEFADNVFLNTTVRGDVVEVINAAKIGDLMVVTVEVRP